MRDACGILGHNHDLPPAAVAMPPAPLAPVVPQPQPIPGMDIRPPLVQPLPGQVGRKGEGSRCIGNMVPDPTCTLVQVIMSYELCKPRSGCCMCEGMKTVRREQ